MDNKDEQLVAEFLAPAKREIPDGGFSRRVMRRLPGRSLRVSRAWSACGLALAAALFVALGGVPLLVRSVAEGLRGWLRPGLLEQADPLPLLAVWIALACIACGKAASSPKGFAR